MKLRARLGVNERPDDGVTPLSEQRSDAIFRPAAQRSTPSVPAELCEKSPCTASAQWTPSKARQPCELRHGAWVEYVCPTYPLRRKPILGDQRANPLRVDPQALSRLLHREHLRSHAITIAMPLDLWRDFRRLGPPNQDPP